MLFPVASVVPVNSTVMFLRLMTAMAFISLVLVGLVWGLPEHAVPSTTTPKCDVEPLAQMMKRSAAVFSGRAVEVNGSEETQVVRLAVTKSWKGVRTSEVTL